MKKYIVILIIVLFIFITGYFGIFMLNQLIDNSYKSEKKEDITFVSQDKNTYHKCFDYTSYNIGDNKLYRDCNSSLSVKTNSDNIQLYQAINRGIVTKKILDKHFKKSTNDNATIYKGYQHTIIYCNNGNIYLGDDTLNYKRNMCEKEILTISFANSKCNSKKKILYTLEDGREIHSTCGNITINSSINGKMSLKEALEKDYIRLSNIYMHMTYEYGLYDGGSKGFSYKASDNNLSTNDFYLTICNSTTNNYNILFTNENNYDFC